MLEEYEYFKNLFQGNDDDEDTHVLMGEDLGSQLTGPYGIVYTHYHTPSNIRGEVGVIGPVRLNYTQVVPTGRYFGDLIEEIVR